MLPTHFRRARFALAISAILALTGFGCRQTKPAPTVPPPPKVVTVVPVEQNIQGYYEYNGYLEAIESVQVQARVEGMLTKILFQEGEEVQKGAALYTIDNREYLAGVAKSEADIAKSEADIANARVQVQLAQIDFDRFEKLGVNAAKAEIDKSSGTLVATQAQLKLAIASKAAAEAALTSSKLKLEYTDIRAEISGRVGQTLVTRGNLVGQKEPTLLTTILSLDPLYIYFDVPERDFVEYQRSVATNTFTRPAKGDLRVDIGVVGEEGYPHAGFMDFRDNRVETGTGTVRLRGRIDNPTVGSQKSRLLYPGLYSRVRVPQGQPKPMLLIPEDALMTGQEGQYVYAIGTDGNVAKRTVKVGPQVWRTPAPDEAPTSGWCLKSKSATADKTPPPALRSVIAVETSSDKKKGLQAGDVVIVVGLQKVRPGAPAESDPWELTGPPTANR